MAVAILGHMQRFYDLLDSKAKDDDKLEGRVYSGQITKDFTSLDLPVPYYSRMTRLMVQMGCMTQIQRGGRANPSIWALHYRPTEELFSAIDPKESNLDQITEQVRMYQSATSQQLRDMRRTIKNQEASLSHLTNQVASLQSTVDAMPTNSTNTGATDTT